ncbi:LpxL/LpxP family acyltransferase [Thiohalomonas denitrificans]|uniref:LpxL/LpxP family acyltransferase n=1 Tax=Thiohalomonas denitrificans TaxID=415747 RepID=UPI0026F24873|nr:lipid A biosynthesis acyltransferase [Thiohalomonas denitrificans]
MSRQWMRQPERGSRFLIRLIVWIALKLGRPVARAFLYPISLYFVLFSGKSRAASRDYLLQALGRKPTVRDLFRHYHTFAAVILDRVYLLSRDKNRFDVSIHGESLVMEHFHRGKGLILLGSHLGSFEIMRAGGIFEKELPLKVLMYDRNAEKINAALNAVNPEITRTVIPIGCADTLLRAKEAVDSGEMLGVLGDRVTTDERTICCRFFGREAAFPGGPLLLAALLKVPVILAFGILRGGSRYEIHFELLTEEITIEGEDRMDDVRRWMQKYADRLEHHCRQAPYNWFNFYDFWSKP